MRVTRHTTLLPPCAMLLFPLLMLTGGCEGSSPLPRDDERLMHAYVDLLELRDSLHATGADTSRLQNRRVDSVLTSHGFTEEAFRSQFRSVATDQARFERFMQAGEAELRIRRSQRAASPR